MIKDDFHDAADAKKESKQSPRTHVAGTGNKSSGASKAVAATPRAPSLMLAPKAPFGMPSASVPSIPAKKTTTPTLPTPKEGDPEE